MIYTSTVKCLYPMYRRTKSSLRVFVAFFVGGGFGGIFLKDAGGLLEGCVE